MGSVVVLLLSYLPFLGLSSGIAIVVIKRWNFVIEHMIYIPFLS